MFKRQRHDGVDKVIGAAKYGADIQLSGMLHGKVLRSPHAHAVIKSIDTSKAEALPGVTAVVTSKDFPIIDAVTMDLAEGGARLMAEHVMAASKVLYKGHAVAAVSATSPHIAEQALDLIDVDYEVLPPVMDVRAAMEPDAPLLHEDLYTEFSGKLADKKPSNVAKKFLYEEGDIESGFAESDVVVEHEFT